MGMVHVIPEGIVDDLVRLSPETRQAVLALVEKRLNEPKPDPKTLKKKAAEAHKLAQECLVKITKRIRDHDFTAEVLDDRFSESSDEALNYLEDGEREILEADVKDGFGVSAAVEIILGEFVHYLSIRYPRSRKPRKEKKCS
jgi:vacuolar-type H+-ATPase subunit H